MKKLKKRAFLFLLVFLFSGFWLLVKNDKQEILRIVDQEALLKKEKPLKFAVFSDIHFDLDNLKKALEKIKTSGVEFIIITGDLTSIGGKEEFLAVKEVLDQSGFKYYSIPGNHDLYLEKKTGRDFYSQVFGKKFQTLKIGETKFILINNGDGTRGVENQMDWIKEEVKECFAVYCLVFGHMPLNHGLSTHVMGEDSKTIAFQAEELVELFVENKVKEMFAGHLHYSTSYQINGLRTNIVGAITSSRNNQTPRFLLVTKTREELEKETIILNN